jgi:hypothetical protein
VSERSAGVELAWLTDSISRVPFTDLLVSSSFFALSVSKDRISSRLMPEERRDLTCCETAIALMASSEVKSYCSARSAARTPLVGLMVDSFGPEMRTRTRCA